VTPGPQENALRVPTPDQVWQWAMTLTEEIRRAPETMRGAREVLVALARLPEQIDALIVTLDRTVESIDAALGEVSETIVVGMNDRIGHVDDMVSDLRNTLTSLIGAIPVARRALQTSRVDVEIDRP
jgi:ABC-type transporter Mla subunit MlaD